MYSITFRQQEKKQGLFFISLQKTKYLQHLSGEKLSHTQNITLIL